MDGLARFVQFPFRPQQRPGVGETALTAAPRGNDVDNILQRLCSISSSDKDGIPSRIGSATFMHIARFIDFLDTQQSRFDRDKWSMRPRLYTLLRSIGALEYMDEFVRNDIYDISLPYRLQTLPGFLADPDLRHRFLQNQICVLTEARLLESRETDHINVNGNADDHLLPHAYLGAGGFGAVDIVFSRLSAKFYARKRVFRGKDSEATRREQQYLVEEIRLLKLLSHRHLTQIIQSYADHEYIGYLMEPIADCNLHAYLVRRRVLDSEIPHLRHFFGCLAGAVQYLHSMKIRHRDLKLENVLVKQSRVYVADFGTAMEWSTSRRGTTQDRGVPVTEWYMAPEVDERGSRNVASDMWSLGIIFLEILTVVKGQTIPKWKDHLKKKALRVRIEPWPCRNISIIHEWMAGLQLWSPRFQDYEDDSLALKDNAPLSWITDLLTRDPDERMDAMRLIKTISESGYLRDFACFDCVQEFRDPHFCHVAGDRRATEKEHSDRRTIDAEVTAMVEMVSSAEPRMQEDKDITVMHWLEQSSKHFEDLPVARRSTLEIPQSISVDTDGGHHFRATADPRQSETPNATPYQMNGFSSSVSSSRNNHTVSAIRHEGGFFVDQDEDSSVAEDIPDGTETPATPNGLFPIIQDTSSDSSEGARQDLPIDSPMLAEAQDDRLFTILEDVPDEMNTPEPSPHLVKGSPVRLDDATQYKSYMEDDAEEQTVEIRRKQRSLPLHGPLIEENNAASFPMSERRSEAAETVKLLPSTSDIKASPTSVAKTSLLEPVRDVTQPPLTTALLKKLHGAPSPGRPSSSKRPVRPPVVPRPPILLPWYDTTQLDLPARPTDLGIWTPPHPPPKRTSLRVPPLRIQDPPRSFDALRSIEDPKTKSSVRFSDEVSVKTGNAGSMFGAGTAREGSTNTVSANSLSRAKLSHANIDKLNQENAKQPKNEDDGFAAAADIDKAWHAVKNEDDGFAAAAYIDKAWHAAEAVQSLATSVMSETTRKSLSGIGLVWRDKSERLLEYYCKRGKVGAVRALLESGCKCGTPTKPRPGPLFNAVRGGSGPHNKCVRALIGAGCDVNAELRGKTPLHVAIELQWFSGYHKLLAMLLGAGAEANKKDGAGEYPLIKIFKGAADAPLEEFQRQSLALLLNPRIQSSLDINVRQSVTKETALHLAVRRRTAQAVALLVHRGADVNLKDASGTTPLLMAANQWRGEMTDQQERTLTFLLHADAIDVNATGGSLRRSALHHAADAGCALALQRLLQRGADRHLVDKEGNNALAILTSARANGVQIQDMDAMIGLLLG